MKQYKNELIVGALFLIILSGLILWFGIHEQGAYLKIALAAFLTIAGATVFIRGLIKKKKDVSDGIPTDDEMSTHIKVIAASKAFHYSTYLWLLIFLFNSSFSEREEMIGVGILGSAAIYGALLWYYKSSGNTNEE